MKLINKQLKGLTTYVCGEVVTFNTEGVATFSNEKAYKEALVLPYFTEVKEKPQPPVHEEKVVVKEEPKVEPKATTKTTPTKSTTTKSGVKKDTAK